MSRLNVRRRGGGGVRSQSDIQYILCGKPCDNGLAKQTYPLNYANIKIYYSTKKVLYNSLLLDHF